MLGFAFLFILVLLVLFLVSVIYKTNITKLECDVSSSTSKLPPGRRGWPIIGETWDYVSNPERFMRDHMSKYSPEVFTTSLLGEKMAVLCGPLANKFVFANEGRLFRWWMHRSMADVFSFSDVDPESPSWKIVQKTSDKFVRLESIQQYVPAMDSIAREHFDTLWGPPGLNSNNKELSVYLLAKEFTVTMACRMFLKSSGMTPEEVKEIAQCLSHVREGIVSCPLNIPGTSYRQAVNGGHLLMQKLVQIIRERKKEIHLMSPSDKEGCQDLLTEILLASDAEGRFATEKDIAVRIAGFMVGSTQGPTNAIASLVTHLMDHPHVNDKVLQEQLEIAQTKKGPRDVLSWADVQKMEYTWNTVRESMRLAAPGQGGGFREVIADFTYAGFNIPKGWKICWTTHSTHKNPNYFSDPEKFDPTRFEETGPLPFTFVPFGGGRRICSGKEYFRMAMLVFLHSLVTRFKLKRVNSNEKIVYKPGPTPVEGLRVFVQPQHN